MCLTCMQPVATAPALYNLFYLTSLFWSFFQLFFLLRNYLRYKFLKHVGGKSFVVKLFEDISAQLISLWLRDSLQLQGQ